MEDQVQILGRETQNLSKDSILLDLGEDKNLKVIIIYPRLIRKKIEKLVLIMTGKEINLEIIDQEMTERKILIH